MAHSLEEGCFLGASKKEKRSILQMIATNLLTVASFVCAPLQLFVPGNWAYILVNLPHLARCVPWHSHEEEEQEDPPEYSDLDNWSSHPSRAPGRSVEDANFIGLEGHNDAQVPVSQRPSDLFFVHDSCVIPDVILPFLGEGDRRGSGPRRWNAKLRGGPPGSKNAVFAAKVNEQVDLRVAVAAPCFNKSCRIYAPRYRQATVTAFVHNRGIPLPLHRSVNCFGWHFGTKLGLRPEDANRAFDLAYDDVRRAFVHFVDDPENAGRPFFLAGHSQGSLHCLRLLQEEIEPFPARLERFVHAYVGGWCVPQELFGRTLHRIIPSVSPDDVHSVSSWRTAARFHGDWLGLVCSRGSTYYSDSGWENTTWPVLATNPLSWTPSLDNVAAEGDSLVSVFPVFQDNKDPRQHVGLLCFSTGLNLRFGKLLASSREVLGIRTNSLARVDIGPLTARLDKNGVVRVPTVPADTVYHLCEADHLLYHDIDFALFHGSIRRNLNTRLDAWRKCTVQFA
eukprot:TRINITY_DN57166_c0_g1_i1.p1 TRINITY_DN57166_c0_g1~~TRINITY_DN57166_c0_g1_i1.p1  ORF type:complete len:535 (+),score=27.97 TRINITY_DN57166_c0_g1_i1:83-1606(+)